MQVLQIFHQTKRSYGFAYGEAESGGNGFIGNSLFFLLTAENSEYSSWIFQWAFSATAATIVSGSVAERTA